jgi:hypothetical protein
MYSGMVNFKNNPAYFKILPDLLRIPDIFRNFAVGMKHREVMTLGKRIKYEVLE